MCVCVFQRPQPKNTGPPMASEAGPPQPKAVLRGHKAQVHAAAFVRDNQRLLTGDADGFVVAWDLTIMRPRAVWRAHENAILGVAGWGSERVITHGRDNKLIVWKLRLADEAALSTTVPLDPSAEDRPRPWMLHMLEVNTMNFCSFGHCAVFESGVASSSELLIAVPNTLASEAVDIFHLPSQRRIHTVKLGEKNGMVMSVRLFYQSGAALTVVAGYENGLAVVAQLNEENSWDVRYKAQSHSQPILSLDVGPDKDYFITSGADALVVKHPLPTAVVQPQPQQSAAPPASQASPEAEPSKPPTATTPQGAPVSALSATLANAPSQPPPPPHRPKPSVETQPVKVVNTKHSGQQDLRIRSDGRIFATAGWDARVRVYSAKTLKELAVLKWHQVGCYATAFAAVAPADSGAQQDEQQRETPRTEQGGAEADGEAQGTDKPVGSEVARSTTGRGGRGLVPRLVDMSVKDKRILQATTAHWIAAGAKDGKVSLWDIY
ncbi:uncharacterized protein E0L32_001683 [Thyridium curvatum]|uniref:ASTRA-associated protein 1 n=1 Tax=Thyridium curvatum TaxID=1093900 RepID=A0A507AGU6_9PEZI|nr:uncharacterized protein E0L32_001515 [Thyridium curvatum]XP_030990934.1 uncharacterized protein E0L32_001683 [Thyridium curvatum]TPX09055.1 hypothetical protein E0L32_001515 [Thyridium curvatum]TPX09223.1 hypothetical protein E0L32_001683 [Thyridium curvatum]